MLTLNFPNQFLSALLFTLLTPILYADTPDTHSQPLRICTEASPDGFDVVRFNALTTTNASADILMNQLIEFDTQKGILIPSLAEKWIISEDGRTITFELRKDVHFHTRDWFTPSRSMNADDVLISFQRMLDPAHPWYKHSPTGYPHAQSFKLPELIETIKKTDDHTVVFILKHPDATFLPLLSMGFASIYSAEYLDQLAKNNKHDELNQKPIGTGPYMLQSYLKDSQIRYLAHPNYFRGQVPTQQLTYVITPDSQVRLSKMVTNECDLALSANPQEIASALQHSHLKDLRTDAFMTAFLAINTEHGELKKTPVRQAINHAFDQATYVKTLFADAATPAKGPYPPDTWSFKPYHYDYDIEKAKALLKSADLPENYPITIWISNSSSTLNPNPRAGAQLLQNDLNKVGFKAEIKQVEWGELISRAKAGEHDLLFMGWAGDNGDPDNFLTPQFSCNAVKSGINFARFCDENLDQLISKGKTTSDLVERTKLYQAAQQIIYDEALWVPLAHPQAIAIANKKIKGFVVNPFGRVDFSKIILEN